MSQMKETLPSGCGLCGKKDGVRLCSGCRAMPYCSADHQAAHRADHKYGCNRIKKCPVDMEAKEQALRDRPNDDFTNVESVQAQLDTLMENLRLCRGDNIGSRDPVHCLLIRLNRDQECYSFLKWWQHPLKTRSTIGAMQPCHTWISERPIHLSQSSLSREIQGLSHIVSLTLVKIKLYFVLLTAHGAQAYEEATEKNRKIMDGMIDIRTSTIARNPHVANLTILEAQPAIENVKAQIRKLYHTGNKANPYFWPEVINPNESLNAAPSMCSPGSKQEMEATMMWTWQARNESFGALEIVYAAVNDPKDEFIFLII